MMTITFLRSSAAAFRLAAFTAARVTEHPPAVRAQPRRRLGRLIGLGLVACLIGHGAAGAAGTPSP